MCLYGHLPVTEALIKALPKAARASQTDNYPGGRTLRNTVYPSLILRSRSLAAQNQEYTPTLVPDGLQVRIGQYSINPARVNRARLMSDAQPILAEVEIVADICDVDESDLRLVRQCQCRTSVRNRSGGICLIVSNQAHNISAGKVGDEIVSSSRV